MSDLFAGAIVPGLLLVRCICCFSSRSRSCGPPPCRRSRPIRRSRTACARAQVLEVMVAPVLLIVVVLGSILGGLATPTEAAAVGAVGAVLLLRCVSRARNGRSRCASAHSPR